MKTWGRHCLTWRGHQLFRAPGAGAVAQIEPDETHPGMWRFGRCRGDAPSDMVNLSRAKDAAAALVLAGLNEAEIWGGAPQDARKAVRRYPGGSLAERPLCGRVGERL